MKKLHWFKQISNNGSKLENRLSLGEYKRIASNYLVSPGAGMKCEEEEEWSADISQLFIGKEFASGRHSRIYRGVYKQRDVAIKLMSQPKEDGDLASLLEKQFTSEVALLFRLRHPNIITGSQIRKHIARGRYVCKGCRFWNLMLGIPMWQSKGIQRYLPLDGTRNDQRKASYKES